MSLLHLIYILSDICGIFTGSLRNLFKTSEITPCKNQNKVYISLLSDNFVLQGLQAYEKNVEEYLRTQSVPGNFFV